MNTSCNDMTLYEPNDIEHISSALKIVACFNQFFMNFLFRIFYLFKFQQQLANLLDLLRRNRRNSNKLNWPSAFAACRSHCVDRRSNNFESICRRLCRQCCARTMSSTLLAVRVFDGVKSPSSERRIDDTLWRPFQSSRAAREVYANEPMIPPTIRSNTKRKKFEFLGLPRCLIQTNWSKRRLPERNPSETWTLRPVSRFSNVVKEFRWSVELCLVQRPSSAANLLRFDSFARLRHAVMETNLSVVLSLDTIDIRPMIEQCHSPARLYSPHLRSIHWSNTATSGGPRSRMAPEIWKRQTCCSTSRW